jgi:hypothetical protein
VDAAYITSYALGIFANFPVIPQFSIRPEAYYSVKGSVQGNNGSGTYTLNYLDIPVLAVYHIDRKIGLFLGPSMNIYINGKYEGEINGRVQSGNITDDEVKIPDWALILGANYFISNFQIDLRYSLPLTSWPSDSATELKISMFQLLLGVSF